MHGLGLPASAAAAEVDLTEELQAMQVRRQSMLYCVMA